MFDIHAYELLATVETDPRTHPYILNCVRIQGLRKSEEPIPKQFASRNALPNGVIYYQKF